MVAAPQTPNGGEGSPKPDPTERRLRLAPPRSARGFSRSYSRLVGVLKYALPAVALVIVAAVVLWPEFNRHTIDISDPTVRPAAGADGEIQNPQYSGVDEAKRPYRLWAALAQRAEDQIFDMSRPKGELTLISGAVLTLEAQRGRLDRSAKSVHLSGQVTLRRDDGTTMVTDAADIDLADQGARSTSPVTAEGPFGTLSASGFKVEQEGDVIIFTGPSTLILKPGAEKSFEGVQQ